jgi:aspartyl-tRNA synthetase
VVRAIPAPGAGVQPRSFFDKLNEWARGEGAAGLGYIILADEDEKAVGRGPIAKFIPEDVLARICQRAGVGAGDAVFFAAGEEAKAVSLAGKARLRIGDELDLVERDQFALAWITDFPFYEWDEDNKKVDFRPQPLLDAPGRDGVLEAREPLTIKAFQYDLVCNGYEIASGGIRNQLPDVMVKAFEIAGYTRADVEERFGGLYRAFQYGAPPHGGMAAGVDRIVMLVCGAKNLREVALFPMNQQAEDLLMGAPSSPAPSSCASCTSG